MVHTFKAKKFLSCSKDVFEYEQIDDIGVVEYPEDITDDMLSSKTNKMDNIYVSGVSSLEHLQRMHQVLFKDTRR